MYQYEFDGVFPAFFNKASNRKSALLSTLLASHLLIDLKLHLSKKTTFTRELYIYILDTGKKFYI